MLRLVCLLAAAWGEACAAEQGPAAGAVLGNGVQPPAHWPATLSPTGICMPPTYLRTPPAVIPIDVGRQLLVDDFLIERSDLQRSFHAPQKYAGNPLLRPETGAELAGGSYPSPLASGASPFDDGVFFDPADNLFKMWYAAGNCHATALAYSRDGIHWQRPVFDVVPGTNVVIPYDPDFIRDGFSPWIDYASPDPAERYKAFYYARSKARKDSGYLYVSPDGIHWREKLPVADRSIGDNTLLFRNPFRDRWCLSIRHGDEQHGRVRHYCESRDFAGLAHFTRSETPFWAAADALDRPDPQWVVQDRTQLYTIAAAPYESLMLGLFTIHYGPNNDTCEQGGFPKLTQIKVAFSRDGFQWDRSNREIFIAATKRDGDSDRGYVRAAGGCCLVVGDQLYFYYNGHSGYTNDHVPQMYAGGSTHLAILRRDGFASLDAGTTPGTMTTRPLRFTGRHLFVNLDAPHGALTVEVLDEAGNPLPSFGAAECVPLNADGTKLQVTWGRTADLSALAGRTVRFRFRLTNGKLYAFWVSPTARGESRGYVAAGGPGFGGPMDAGTSSTR